MAPILMNHLLCALFCIFGTIPSILTSSKHSHLNSHPLKRLEKYEDVYYDIKPVHDNHMRVVRSLDSNLYLNFNNYQKNFHIKLSPSNSINDESYVEIDKELFPVDHFTFYSGELINEPNSRVTGSIIDGVFYGTVETENGTYQIESSKRYDGKFSSHSIIYHENDVKSNNESAICGKAKMENEKYTKTQSDQHDSINNKSRRKRAATQFPNGNNVCRLYLRVDQFFYKQIYANEGNQNSYRTMNFIMNYLNSYVAYINSVYSSLQFASGSNYFTGLKFAIRRIRILTPDLCNNQSSLSTAEKLICTSNLYDAYTLLNIVSKDTYQEYCLSFTFTGRDLSGLLGLAWIAQVGGNWGVCGTVNNTGIVTIMRQNNREPELSTKLTFTHELGHNLGAQHDDYSQCPSGSQPGGTDGNYIMYPYSQSGTLVNNNKLSACSVTFMGKVIAALASSSSKFCFVAANTSVCGNMVIEADEQCDCGFPGDCVEKCCNPSTCKLNPGSICSPSQGSCCSSSCNYMNNTVTCYSETECVKPVTCSGSSFDCPYTGSEYFKVPTTGLYQLCNSGSQVCLNGTCTGSVCQNYNMTQCYLPGNLSNPTVNKTALCHLACTGSLTNNICQDTFNIPVFNKSGKVLKAGSICAGTGFCDIFSKCRLYDEGSALSKLGKLILNPPTSAQIQTWFQTYWWAIVLVFLGFLLVLGLIGFLIFKCTEHQHPWKVEAKKNAKEAEKNLKNQKRKSAVEERNANFRKRNL